MGTEHRDVIEINGKRYDAATGKILKTDFSSTPAVHSLPPQKKSGQVLDGFTRRSPQAAHHTAPRAGVTHTKKVQKSQTLMRASVKKPTPVAHKQATHLSSQATAPKPSQKSPLVSRYGTVVHRSSVVKKVAPLAVATHTQPFTPAASHTHPSSHPAPKQALSFPTVTKTQKHIEEALSKAHAHELPHHPHSKAHKKRRFSHRLGVTTKAMSISSGVLAVVLLAGFFALQNIPHLSMRVASARAGVAAEMPGYNPAGFSFKGPITYSQGQVRVSFSSNTDDREYSVSQKSTSWNSDALLANYIVAENKQYQTYIEKGRTLYIYDGSNATWIDNGIWYQVEGDSQMSTDQLVRVASSI